MAFYSFKSLLYQWHSSFRQRQTSGFTLPELLIGTIIAGIIVSGLLYMVTQLLQTNQRQSAQSETQRDLQIAMDYINSELRNAVYVYNGKCLQGVGDSTICDGVVNHIPAQSQSIPILAFWKLDPLPTPLQTVCTAGTADQTVPCFSGQTYSLVVYFLSKDSSTANWQGKARITRYAMTQYNADGTANPNYVTPDQSGVTFTTWPFQVIGTTPKNLQKSLPTGNAVALADFIDDKARPSAGDDNITCPNNYDITPNTTTLTNYVTSPFDSTDINIRSFYACVKQGNTSNQDVFVFLRANAFGRPGIGGMSDGADAASLPTLQTQVLSRGVLNESPK